MDPDGRMQETWKRGSYDDIAQHYLSMAGHLVERASVDDGDAVLDIGCGTGNVAITAARHGATVTGIDMMPSMLEQASEHAEVAGIEDVDWRTGPATDLPVEDDAFDVVLSCLGHMYADPPDAAAAELVRVARADATIAFTSWTPADLFPFMAGIMLTYVSSDELPEFTEPPFVWGDSDVVSARLEDAVSDLKFETETTTYPTLSPEHFWEELAAKSGTFIEYLELVEEDERSALREEMVETIQPYFDESRNEVELQYLLTTATV